MNTQNINQSLFAILIFSLLFTACIKLDTDLKTEMDINTISFASKLAVSATLDGERGDFNIFIAEGRALCDHVPFRKEIIIRDGEIRLFEDDKLILTEPVPIDMFYIARSGNDDENGNWINATPQYWYRFNKSGISTRSGSVYRLEVEIDGYETATAVMTMPSVPVVTASMDTTVMVIKHWSPLYPNLNVFSTTQLPFRHYIYLPDGSYEGGFWPVSVHLTDPNPNENNYFALGTFNYTEKFGNMRGGIGVSDVQILQDNPDLEAQKGGLADTDYSDFYFFSPLFISDRSFSGKTAPLIFFSISESNSDPYIDHLFYIENHCYEKAVVRTKTFLRVQHFPESTFKYYRGQALQRQGVGFFTEPVTITGNVKNGYGYFNVFNAVSIQLLEYDYEHWTRIDPVIE